MLNLINWLKGKKTYILVIIGAITILLNFLTGDVTWLQFLTSKELLDLIELLGLGALRSGVKNLK